MTTTTQRELTLPIVDLSAATGSVEERADLLERLRTAAHDLGFFYVTGHGIPLAVRHDLFSATRAFFTLPEGTRREISNLRSPQFRGYTSLASEHTAGAADEREQIDMDPNRPPSPSGPRTRPTCVSSGRTRWPSAVRELRPSVLSWLSEAGRVARTVLGLLAEHSSRDAPRLAQPAEYGRAQLRHRAGPLVRPDETQVGRVRGPEGEGGLFGSDVDLLALVRGAGRVLARKAGVAAELR